MKPKKTYDKIMSCRADSNIGFVDLQHLLSYLGFNCKNINGDHFIYYYKDIPDNINIQPNGNKAKSYQIKQIRNYLIKNNISL